MFPFVNRRQKIAKKESRFLIILFKYYFIPLFRSERGSEKGPEDSNQNHGFLVEL